MTDQLNHKGFSIGANGEVTAKSLALDSASPGVAGRTAAALSVTRRDLVDVTWSGAQATAASTTAIRSAVTDNGAQQVITSGITQPTCARVLSVTYGGTAGDIKGGHQVTIAGKDYWGAAISEVFPAATADTAGTVYGTKAFAEVTSITIPAHDGTGATTAIGVSEKLGLPYKLSYNSVVKTLLNGTPEATAATVTTSTSAVSLNTIDLNSSLNGTPVLALVAV